MLTNHVQEFLGLSTYLEQMGVVGTRLAQMQACEGTAGNMSIGLGWQVDPLPLFPDTQPFDLKGNYPELTGKSFLVTGSGCRLRDIADEGTGAVGLVSVNADGRSAVLNTSRDCRFTRLTTEFNSHLVLHQHAFSHARNRFHAVVHAQPVHLTYLTHIKRYQDGKRLCEAVLRWQPELTVVFPLGFGYVPFRVPNSEELMEMTRQSQLGLPLLVWEKHGVLAMSDKDIFKAYDYVEYVETGARYEYMNLLAGEAGEGLLASQILGIRRHFQLPGSIDGSS